MLIMLDYWIPGWKRRCG